MNIHDFRAVVHASPLLPKALQQAMIERAGELTNAERKHVSGILVDALRIHTQLLEDGLNELETILRKAKAAERSAAEASDTTQLPQL